MEGRRRDCSEILLWAEGVVGSESGAVIVRHAVRLGEWVTVSLVAPGLMLGGERGVLRRGCGGLEAQWCEKERRRDRRWVTQAERVFVCFYAFYRR